MMVPSLYPLALGLISLAVCTVERLWPSRRQQCAWRRELPSDLVHLVFNGHFLGVLLFGIAQHRVLPHVDAWLRSAGLHGEVYRAHAAGWPLWIQIPVALLIVDFLQWGVHNLLHRVPCLWELHKVHHSVTDDEMDWIVSFRFQWAEVVVYRSLLYVPLAFFGFGYEAVMTHAIVGTLVGHLNHANLDVSWGPLRYVLNSPRMHLWHHDHEADARTTVNFGIIFSLWDWLFGTAKFSAETPAKLGFPGVDAFPRGFLAHAAWPLPRLLGDGRAGRVAAAIGGMLVLAGGYWLHLPRG